MNINTPTINPGRATERDLDDRQAALAIIEQNEATERMKQHHRAAFAGAASVRALPRGCDQQGRYPQAAEPVNAEPPRGRVSALKRWIVGLIVLLSVAATLSAIAVAIR